MSEFISAETALKELLCGKKLERCYKSEWEDLTADDPIDVFFTSESFRLKPRTVNLNGVDVGQLRTAMWCVSYPKEVNLEFKTEDDAHHFYANALKIFNGV